MTHKERKKRREEMIAEIDSGVLPEVVADNYGLSVTYVRTLRKRPIGIKITTFQILARLLNNESHTKIAKDFNMTKQHIFDIARRARKAGINV